MLVSDYENDAYETYRSPTHFITALQFLTRCKFIFSNLQFKIYIRYDDKFEEWWNCATLKIKKITILLKRVLINIL